MIKSSPSLHCYSLEFVEASGTAEAPAHRTDAPAPLPTQPTQRLSSPLLTASEHDTLAPAPVAVAPAVAGERVRTGCP